MHSPLVSWSRIVFLAGIVLALVLIIPAAWFPIQLGKLALFALLLLVSCVLFIMGRGVPELARAHGMRLVLLVGLLPLAYLLSALLAGTNAISIAGFSVEVDTVLFTTIAFVAFFLSFGFFKTLRTVRLLESTITWVAVAVIAFQGVIIFFGTSVIPFAAFTDRSFNLVGKWNDLGLLAGLLAVMLLVRGDLARDTLPRRVLFGIGFAALVLFLGIVNFSFIWWALLGASLIVGLTAFMTQREAEHAERESNPYANFSWASRLPWFSLAGAVLSLVFLLYGAAINQELTSRFPVSSLEVRPSYSSTYDVIRGAQENSALASLLGTGPNTFSQSWIAHKPSEVNQSAFWNLDFNVGFSTLLTALGTTGLVGEVAWLLPIILVLMGFVRAVRYSLLSREERLTTLSVGLGSLLLLGSLIFYVPSQNIVLLSFILAGATFGYLWRQGRHSAAEEGAMPIGAGGAAWVLIAILILGSVWGAWATDRRFVAEAISNQGAADLQVGNADSALAHAQSAQGIETTNNNLRLAIEGGILKLQQIAKDSSTPAAELQRQFAAVASTTIATAKNLALEYPNDYRSYLSLARVYDLLATLKIQGAYESAEQSYQKALALNPSAPDILLALARLEGTHGNATLTQKYLSQSLTLKPNYTDAILMVVQLDVANNDIPSAIQAAQAAAQTAPGVAPIWFELGLLYYAGGDTKDAIAPLEQSIKIVPDYANAKYFLGLSYQAQGRVAEALKEFEDLAHTNPDNAEVNLILNNLRSGKKPFDSAQPPITNKPATRPSAPINE